MLKLLKNILTILIICLVAIGININTVFIVNKTKIAMAEDNNKISVTLVSDVEENLKNPKYITIGHYSEKPTTLNFYDEYMFNAIIYKNNNVHKICNLNKLSNKNPYQLNLAKNSSHDTAIDISQENLKLQNGKYKIVISSNAMELKYSIEPITINVEYISDSTYVPASYEKPKGKMPITLYFADKYNLSPELIGITRFVDIKSSAHKVVVSELQKGPLSNMGLSEKPPIGKVNYAVLRGSTVYISLPSDEEIYNNGSAQSSIAMTSFKKSLLSLPHVKRIKFLVDGKKADTFFHGIDISDFIEKDTKNKAYLAFNTDKRYYLVEYDVNTIGDSDTVEDKVSKVIDILKDDKHLNLSYTIPKDVNVIDFSIDGKTLVLNFSSSFINSYNGKQNLQRLMLDSILLSFTTIDDIEYIQILVENNKIDNFAGVNISSPLSRPLYINPEM